MTYKYNSDELKQYLGIANLHMGHVLDIWRKELHDEDYIHLLTDKQETVAQLIWRSPHGDIIELEEKGKGQPQKVLLRLCHRWYWDRERIKMDNLTEPIKSVFNLDTRNGRE